MHDLLFLLVCLSSSGLLAFELATIWRHYRRPKLRPIRPQPARHWIIVAQERQRQPHGWN